MNDNDKKFSVDTELGLTIITAQNLEEAKRIARNSLQYYRKELGYLPEINSIKEATEEDLAWVKAMGGRTE